VGETEIDSDELTSSPRRQSGTPRLYIHRIDSMAGFLIKVTNYKGFCHAHHTQLWIFEPTIKPRVTPFA
jgi:hypothetical protein